MKKMTMRKLAELCNVSVSTVSRALSGSGKVEREVALRIYNEAKHRNYRFNDAHIRHWGLLCKFDGEAGSYELSMLDELTRCILARGDTFAILPKCCPELIRRDWYDGVIAVSWLTDDELAKLCNFNVVLVNNYSIHRERIWSVYSDDELMIRDAVDYLVGKGHSRICIWNRYDINVFSDVRRINTFQQIMRERKLKPYIYYWDTIKVETNQIENMVADGITAILLPGEFSLKNLKALFNIPAIRIPEQYSVITLENRYFSPYNTPALTTFEQDFAKLAEAALATAELLRKSPSGSSVKNQKIPYIFHERQSVASLSSDRDRD